MAPITTFLYSAFTCLTLALAAPVQQNNYEVIIIGGGPAGLSALSALSRVRRTAVMFDSGQYRNSMTREMHDVIGNDGTPPAQFRALAREQISQYDTSCIVDTKITSIVAEQGMNGFTSFTAKDINGNRYTARKIILGTGMRDLVPRTPGLMDDAWGNGVFWCPWCDGYEHRDQPFGLLCPFTKILANVREMSTLNNDILALVNGTWTDDAEAQLDASDPLWRRVLATYNVTINNKIIASFTRLQDGNKVTDGEGRQFDMFRVTFTDGSSVVRDAFLANFGTEQRSSLPYQMGLDMTNGGNSKIVVDIKTMKTSLGGVYAVGDANSDGSTNVPHAMFSAKRAAVYIHGELSTEDMKSAVYRRASPSSRDEFYADLEKRLNDDIEDIWDKVRRG